MSWPIDDSHYKRRTAQSKKVGSIKDENKKLKAEIERKDKLLREIGNILYIDQDGIGDLFEARRLVAEALKEEL